MALEEHELKTLFERLDDGELLGLWASVMAELNSRGVVRSDNNPIGDSASSSSPPTTASSPRATRTQVTT